MPRENSIPLVLVEDTTTMSEDEWLAKRNEGIGGSDVAAILNKSPWKTNLELFHQKRNIPCAIKKSFNQDAKDAGHIFESFVVYQTIRYFKAYYQIELKLCKTQEEFNQCENGIFNDNRMYQCGDGKHPYVFANVDRLIKISGKIGIMECKTTNDGKYNRTVIQNYKHGVPPSYYDLQCRHYMGGVNLDFAFLCVIWGFTLNNMACIRIDRDYEYEDFLFEQESKFWYCVQNNIEPDISDADVDLLNEYYYRFYGEVDPTLPPVFLDDTWEKQLNKLIELQDLRNMLEEKLDTIKDKQSEIANLLYPTMQNHGRAYYRNKEGELLILQVKTPKKRATFVDLSNILESANFDWRALRAEYPEMWEDYQKEVFDVRSFRTEFPALFNKYKLPDEPSTSQGSRSSYTITKGF